MRKRQAGRIGEKGRCLGKVPEWEMRRQGHLVAGGSGGGGGGGGGGGWVERLGLLRR